MPDRPDVAKGELAGILRAYGLNPRLFDDLIREAIINQWTPQQFIGEVYASDEFAAAFPGIFNKDGSLKLSPAEYLQLAYGFGGYVDIGRNFGLKLGPKKIGLLVEGLVSPDEWAFRARIWQQAKSSEVYRSEFNKILEASGREALGKGEWFKLLASKSSARIENLYEAVSLSMAEDLEISPEEALSAARQIGAEEPAARVDVVELIAQVRRQKNLIGPELRAAGITDADLAVLASGADPKAIRPQLEQILRNRQALVQSAAAGGGVRSIAQMFPATTEGL